MADLNQSYAKTAELLKAKKTAEAAEEYKAGLGSTVRKMYAEVASTTPARFTKLSSDDWSEWARTLFVQMRKTEDALNNGQNGTAAKGLTTLRDHIFQLHEKSQTQKSNDLIFIFNKKVNGFWIQGADLSAIRTNLDTTTSSAKATADPAAYAKAKAEWAKVADPILKDGKVGLFERGSLRKATRKFYDEYGTQLE